MHRNQPNQEDWAHLVRIRGFSLPGAELWSIAGHIKPPVADSNSGYYPAIGNFPVGRRAAPGGPEQWCVVDNLQCGCDGGERCCRATGRASMWSESPRPGVSRGGAVALCGTLRISTAGHGVVHMHPVGYLCHVPSESLHSECPENSIPAQNRVHALTCGG